MYEHQKGRKAEKLGSLNGRPSGYRLSTIHGEDRLDALAGLYSDDRYPRIYRNYLDDSEFTHSLFIVLISAGGVGAGISIILEHLFKWWIQ